jgi:zinc protease
VTGGPLRLPETAVTTLADGIRITAVRRDSVPVTEVRLRLPSCPTEGATALDVLADVVGQVSTGPGVEFAVSATSDRILARASCLTSRIEDLLRRLVNAAASDGPPGSSYGAARATTMRRIRTSTARPDRSARHLLDAAYFGDHAYGNHPTLAALASLSDEDLKQAAHRNLGSNGASLVVVGSSSVDAAMRLATDVVAGWSGRPVPLPLPQPKPRTGQVVKAGPGSGQRTHIRAAIPAAPRSSRDYPALYLAVLAFGGYPGSRLTRSLRDQLGMAYSPAATWDHRVAHSAIQIGLEVKWENASAALAEVRSLLLGLATHPVTVDELDRARTHALGALQLGLATQAAVADLASALAAVGRDLSSLDDLAAELGALDPEAVSTAAARYLRPELLTAALYAG